MIHPYSTINNSNNCYYYYFLAFLLILVNLVQAEKQCEQKTTCETCISSYSCSWCNNKCQDTLSHFCSKGYVGSCRVDLLSITMIFIFLLCIFAILICFLIWKIRSCHNKKKYISMNSFEIIGFDTVPDQKRTTYDEIMWN